MDQSSRLIKRPEHDLIRWYNGICPTILLANRQIHAEACEILYRENTFTIYVRHPRNARLPMNESRADEDSFVFLSWKHRHWAHPRNHKIPLSVLRNHSHLSYIRRVHVNLPLLNDLAAADRFMRRTIYAKYYGLRAWTKKLLASDGKLPDVEQRRMDYINMMKMPIDEVADVLEKLPRIDELVIHVTSETHEIAIIDFVISGLLQLRGIKHAQFLYRAKESLIFMVEETMMENKLKMMEPRLLDLERQLESTTIFTRPEGVPGLSPEAVEMLEMLEVTRRSMLFFRQSIPEGLDIDIGIPIALLDHTIPE